ncbi:unnamed protein product, partial [Onchocerca flexuosa]|uniref:Dus domain-containing protein n=1 Tax=Onchocerca flexuosa TaxID=387005 RepID=A0A183HUU5_9BILA
MLVAPMEDIGAEVVEPAVTVRELCSVPVEQTAPVAAVPETFQPADAYT